MWLSSVVPALLEDGLPVLVAHHGDGPEFANNPHDMLRRIGAIGPIAQILGQRFFFASNRRLDRHLRHAAELGKRLAKNRHGNTA